MVVCRTRSAVGAAALLFLAACGGGDDGAVSSDPGGSTATAPVTGPGAVPPSTSEPPVDVQPDPGTPPSPGPSPAPAPGGSPTPATGREIDLSKPFSQAITCYYGDRPYYSTEIGTDFIVAFDGDALSLSDANGKVARGGRFTANDGNGIERENYEASALQRARLGGAGQGGVIYFVKNLAGVIVSAGHNGIAGGDFEPDVECGAAKAAEWIRPPDPAYFSASDISLSWPMAVGPAVNCAARLEDDTVGPVFSGRLEGQSNGNLGVRSDAGEIVYTVPGPGVIGREVVIFPKSPRQTPGGGYVYRSQPGVASDPDQSYYDVEVRWNTNALNAITHRDPGQYYAREACVPAPLDPRIWVSE